MKLKKFYKLKCQEALECGKEESAVFIYLSFILKLSSTDFFLKQDEEIADSDIKAFEEGFKKYLYENKPIQYLTNETIFFGYPYYVDERVLIPRFETEELTENVLLLYDQYFQGESVEVCDIGTGSGAIAITLSLEEENMHVYASDISNVALEVARLNNTKLGGKVIFLQGDMVEPFYGHKFDIIVSNPPYIPETEEVDPLVKENEPNIALFGGDGTYFYDIILKNVDKIKKDRCIIAFEHGYNKNQAIEDLAYKYLKSCKVIHKKDLQGLDRMTFILVGDFDVK